MKKLLTVLLLLFGLQSYAQMDTLSFINWVNRNLIDLKNKESDAKLDSIFSNKRIIGIGEPVHGSKTINEIRLSLTKELIINQDFNKIAVEMPFYLGLKVNDYVCNGKGNINDLSKLFYKHHYFNSCSEFINFIEWLKVYNKTKERKIEFFGFDIQGNINLIDHLIFSYTKKDPSFSNELKAIKQLFDEKGLKLSNLTLSEQDFITKVLLKTEKKNRTNKKIISENELNKLAVSVLKNNLHFSNSNFGKSLIVRDSCNAEIIKWIANKGNEPNKVVVLAHNGHLGKSHYLAPRIRTNEPDIFLELWEEKTLTGYWLDNYFYDEYYFLGLQFNSGSFLGFNFKDNFQLASMTISPPSINSLNYLLGKAESDYFFLELKPNKTVTRSTVNYLLSFQNSYNIGAAYDYKYIKSRLADYYDAIIYINKIKETTLIIGV